MALGLGVRDVWAKAITEHHGRILQRVGAHHVVFPEHDMGHRVAHLVGGRIIDWFQLDADFAMVETVVPADLANLRGYFQGIAQVGAAIDGGTGTSGPLRGP